MCEWEARYCGPELSECAADCAATDPDQVAAIRDSCLDTLPTSCVEANCCLQFTYTEYAFGQLCVRIR